LKIAVVALGKIGLPLAVQFASKGHRVVGADISERTVDLVNAGREPFPGEAHLAARLEHVVSAGLLTATTDTTVAVTDSDAVVVVVPLFVDGDGVPDFAAMDSATKAIAAGIKPGALVSYETTLPVGTTRGRFAPMLHAGSGLLPGADVHLAFSPERVLTGRVFADLARYPKIVGGVTPECGRAATAFYEEVLDFDDRPDLGRPNGVWDLGSAEAAEMTKLAETTYRDVNIALANQFARFAGQEGIDIYQVIEAANSQPYSHLHNPGIAVGGHCIPVYPRMYLWNDPEATVVRSARSANEAMPAHAVSLLAAEHGNLAGVRVVVLGASYRGGVKETAFSGVFPTVEALAAAGATPLVHDPMFSDQELRHLGFTPYHYGEPADAAIVQADHPEYRDLAPDRLPGVQTLVDGRNVTRPELWDGVVRSRIGVGRAQSETPAPGDGA
jgi:nucleotide sugar dehydrogenase